MLRGLHGRPCAGAERQVAGLACRMSTTSPCSPRLGQPSALPPPSCSLTFSLALWCLRTLGAAMSTMAGPAELPTSTWFRSFDAPQSQPASPLHSSSHPIRIASLSRLPPPPCAAAAGAHPAVIASTRGQAASGHHEASCGYPWGHMGPLVLRRHSTVADTPPPASSTRPLLQSHVRDLVQQFDVSGGLNYKSCDSVE